MKLHNVPLDQIVWNPWRDKTLAPIDNDHVNELRASIDEHGFFASLKGRRRNGMIELGCGHARFEAARKAKLETIPIYLDDLDDDQMLRLMTDENATQLGNAAGAILNEVGAVARRLVEGLLEGQEGTIVPSCVARAFENKHAIEIAQGRLRSGRPDRMPIGHATIRAYLGQGKPENSLRGERQIREALSALKQSGRYDEIADDVLRKHPLPVKGPPAKGTDVTNTKGTKPRRRILDERTANVFKNDHQFHAFREAVTTSAAQKAIPVTQQLALAKEIMREKPGSSEKPKQTAAPYIKIKVQEKVQEQLKEQRKINTQEREQFLAEEADEQIKAEIDLARRWLNSLVASLLKLEKLADKYPAHPRLGGFSAKLDDLVASIKQFGRKLK